MTTQLAPLPIFKAFDNAGLPLAFGFLYTYQAGTTTPQATYTDSTGNTPNPNPIQLNARGEAQIWLNPLQNYKFLLTDALGNQIPGWPVDNISGSLYPGQSIIPNTDNAYDLGSLTDRWRNGYFGTQLYVGANNYPVLDASGNIGYWKQTAAEIAAGVTPVNYAYAPGNVLRYGTNTTPGTTDMTAAFNAAISQWQHVGSPVYAPAGTYLVGTLYYPNGYGFILRGEGPTQTILLANASNIPVLKKVQSAGACEAANFSNFSIQANAAGSTGPAFDCSGMRTCLVKNVRGLSNGTSGFYSLFSLAAYPYLCYGNEFDLCGMAGTQGFTKCFDFNNGGTGSSGNNANVTIIRNVWIYSNTGLQFGIDALRSADTSINGGDIESNVGATAINSGNSTFISGVWMEANAHNIAYTTAADGTANNGLAIGNYLSTADTVSFSGCSANVWIANNEAGDQTWSNNNGTNLRLKATGDSPGSPTITFNSGQTGTLSFTSSTTLTQPALTNETAYFLVYSWTPGTASTASEFNITPPSNYAIVGLTLGMWRGASGEPRATAVASMSAAGGTAATFWTDNLTNDQHNLTAVVRIKHVDP